MVYSTFSFVKSVINPERWEESLKELLDLIEKMTEIDLNKAYKLRDTIYKNNAKYFRKDNPYFTRLKEIIYEKEEKYQEKLKQQEMM